MEKFQVILSENWFLLNIFVLVDIVKKILDVLQKKKCKKYIICCK